uniref:C1q domain-containing protein n=1 Tax=Stegastes partitus TaxID=144197 RepID=A0A3B5AI55_9TELE
PKVTGLLLIVLVVLLFVLLLTVSSVSAYDGVCPTDCKGVMGPPGEPGLPGPVGSRGLKGTNGMPGDKGMKGDMGDMGAMGDEGMMGPAGETGPKGEKGHMGDMGRLGPPGPCMPSIQSAFSAVLTKSFPEPNAPVVFSHTLYNYQWHYDDTNGIYTAPVNGTYVFSYHLTIYDRILKVGIFHNYSPVVKTTGTSMLGTVSHTVILHLIRGDKVWIQVKDTLTNGMYIRQTIKHLQPFMRKRHREEDYDD